MKKTNSPEIESLYIHVPFCEHLCDYCDFTKLQYFRIFAEPYIRQVEKELDSYNIEPSLKTIYIGGGTPTVLDDDLFERLLFLVSKYSKDAIEYTVECNPESLTDRKLEIMKKYGVNRLSIGVESTNNNILKAINRHHTFEDVKIAIKKARNYVFDNLNVDLILGLPNVTKDLLKADITNILALNVNHISCYSLSVHDNTVFGIKGVQEPDEDLSRDMYDIINSVLVSNGFEHYEVSNWCKPGKESQHNLTYWKDNQYYGIGLGASGFVGKYRYTNTKSINDYNQGNYVSTKEVVSFEEDEEYFIMLNLRTRFGISNAEYKKRFGKDFIKIHAKTLKKLEDEKLIVIANDCVIPRYEGMMVLDQIILDLISE